jgi:hypothetical protein
MFFYFIYKMTSNIVFTTIIFFFLNIFCNSSGERDLNHDSPRNKD